MYILVWCFTPHREYFTHTAAASIMVGRKSGSAQGKPMTISKLLKAFPLPAELEGLNS